MELIDHIEGKPQWSGPLPLLNQGINVSQSVRDWPNSEGLIAAGPNQPDHDIVLVAESGGWQTPVLPRTGSPLRLVLHIHAADTFQQWICPVSQDGRYATKYPIIVEVSDADHDGIYVVTDRFSMVFGSGASPAEAIKDYADLLFTALEELEEDEGSLGIALRQELASLRQHIAHT